MAPSPGRRVFPNGNHLSRKRSTCIAIDRVIENRLQTVPETRWNPCVRAALIAILLSGCGWSFTPPDHPVHDQEQGGALHARRFETPFLCGTAGDPDRAESCPETRPSDDRVSCDSVGCHGTFDFSEASASARDLIGSDGPSCYTCHGREWED